MAAQLISEARVSQPRLLGPYRGDGIRALVHLVAGHDPGMSPLSIDEWSYLNDRIYNWFQSEVSDLRVFVQGKPSEVRNQDVAILEN